MRVAIHLSNNVANWNCSQWFMVSFSFSLYLHAMLLMVRCAEPSCIFEREKIPSQMQCYFFFLNSDCPCYAAYWKTASRCVSYCDTRTHPCRYTNCAIKQSLWRWQISDRVATYCDDRNLILIVHIVPLKKFAARKFVQHTTKQIGGICVYLCLVRILYHTHTQNKKNTLLHCRTTYNDAII